MRRLSLTLLTVLVLVPGCLGDLASSALSEVKLIEDTTSTGDDSATGTGSGPISTVTSATNASGGDTEASTTASDSDSATSEVDTTSPDDPPSISEYSLTPQPITAAGPIAVKIWADADGVRMDLAGTVTELTMSEPGLFEGEIAVVTGFDHGGVAVFSPWRGEAEGAALEVPYAVELPEPGTEALFDVDVDVGSGQITAIAALPEGAVELLTLVGNGTSGCYLRRRGAGGEVLGELAPLLPDHCKAIDLQVREGELFALMEAETLQGSQWWVAKVPYWGAPHVVVATGEIDEVAHALAVSCDEGIIAVCGAAPTIQPKDLTDAFVRVVGPDFSYTRTFDHGKDGMYHVFDERARGCAFDPADDERLVIVGEVYGRLDKQIVENINRRFDVLYDLEIAHGDLRVADASLGAMQSVATDIAIAEGDTFIVGYVCGDALCDQPEGRMWVLDDEGDLTSTRSLGLHPNTALAPSRIRVTPIGHLVVTSGGIAGSDEAFVVRGYDPLKVEPLYSYIRQDAGLIHFAHALAIGPYGQVYAGGFGANGRPLFVIVNG